MRKGSRLSIAFAVLLAVWIALSLTGTGSGAATLVALVEFVIGTILLVRLARRLLRQSIWRLRNRLIVTYLFIGVMPVVLILTLVTMGAYLVTGQIAVFLVKSELERRIQGMREPAQIMSWSTPDTGARLINQMAPLLRTHFPHIQLLLRCQKDFRFPQDALIEPPPPGWDNASGVLVKDGRYYGWTHVRRGETQVLLLEPITRRLLSDLVPKIGMVRFYDSGDHRDAAGDNPPSGGEVVHTPPQQNRFDKEVTWLAHVNISDWQRPGSREAGILVVTTRPSAVLDAIFGEETLDIGQLGLWSMLIVAILFLLVEIASLMAGISMTRTITSAVHELYEGTKRVTSGDFGHRIPVRGRDQLAELGTSFNSMTQNLERLFAVEKEKERLQSELEIASEVQLQLFPKDVPRLKTIELTGLCMPARMVSGDYYDYMCLEDGGVALAIGDVAGKGISAALLMASLQSIMRTQLAAGHALQNVSGKSHQHGGYCTARMVGQLNRQLFANTSPEKYATFYFGMYNEEEQVLTYTNAGHLPPILLRGGEAQFLEVTGTVVGAFPNVQYEEKTIALQKGDMLVAYTDGITEPENEYGEEFGVERLTDLLLKNQGLPTNEIIARAMSAVRQWTSADEMPDDMTLLVARRRG